MVDKFFQRIALPIILMAILLLFGFMLNHNINTEKESTESNAYIRVINCIVSIDEAERLQGDIEKCYSAVEKDLNVKLKRYDSSLR